MRDLRPNYVLNSGQFEEIKSRRLRTSVQLCLPHSNHEPQQLRVHHKRPRLHGQPRIHPRCDGRTSRTTVSEALRRLAAEAAMVLRDRPPASPGVPRDLKSRTASGKPNPKAVRILERHVGIVLDHRRRLRANGPGPYHHHGTRAGRGWWLATWHTTVKTKMEESSKYTLATQSRLREQPEDVQPVLDHVLQYISSDEYE